MPPPTAQAAANEEKTNATRPPTCAELAHLRAHASEQRIGSSGPDTAGVAIIVTVTAAATLCVAIGVRLVRRFGLRTPAFPRIRHPTRGMVSRTSKTAALKRRGTKGRSDGTAEIVKPPALVEVEIAERCGQSAQSATQSAQQTTVLRV